MPLLGRQAGLLQGPRGCRFLRLRFPSCTPLGRLTECLVELWIAGLGLVSSEREFALTAGDLPGRWRVWCVKTASRLAHASGRLLVFIALSQSRLLLHPRWPLLLASGGTLLCRSGDRGPIPRACGVDLQCLLASARGVINARSFPGISRRRLSSSTSTCASTRRSSLTRGLSTTTWPCSLRPEGS